MTTDEQISQFFKRLFKQNKEFISQYEDGLITGPEARDAIGGLMHDQKTAEVCASVRKRASLADEIREILGDGVSKFVALAEDESKIE